MSELLIEDGGRARRGGVAEAAETPSAPNPRPLRADGLAKMSLGALLYYVLVGEGRLDCSA